MRDSASSHHVKRGGNLDNISDLEAEPDKTAAKGEPESRTYLEAGLSPALTKAITDYVQGEKDADD